MQRVDGSLRKESFLDLLLSLFKIKPTQEQRAILPVATKPGEWKKGHEKRQLILDQPTIFGFIALGHDH